MIIATLIGIAGVASTASATVTAAAPPWRTSLSTTCWTDASCRRALEVTHGGAWDPLTRPYDSMPAFERAFAKGADAVKGDFRVTADNVMLSAVRSAAPPPAHRAPECVECVPPPAPASAARPGEFGRPSER